MRTDPDVTRAVRSWLDEGVDRLPERVLDSVLDAVPTTPQRRSWWPAWRNHPMTNIVRVAAVVAAVVVAGLVGIRLLPSGGIGSPAPTASPTPSPSPAPDAFVGSLLSPGTYRVGSQFGKPFTIGFPVMYTFKTLNANDAQFNISQASDGTVWVVVDIPDNVYADPCDTAAGTPAPPVASTVDGLVTALTHMTGFDAGPVADATIGGHSGKSFTLTNSINTDTAGCTGGPMLLMWTFPGGAAGTNGGATEQIWVIDVDGTPVVIDGESFPTTSPADRATIEPIVNSIVFD